MYEIEIQDIFAPNMKVSAIKSLSRCFGFSITEAKSLVDALNKGNPLILRRTIPHTAIDDILQDLDTNGLRVVRCEDLKRQLNEEEVSKDAGYLWNEDKDHYMLIDWNNANEEFSYAKFEICTKDNDGTLLISDRLMRDFIVEKMIAHGVEVRQAPIGSN